MKSLLVLSFLLIVTGSVFSQQNVLISDIDTTSAVFAKVEQESKFPGGAKAWLDFIVSNLKYPKKALKRHIEGTVVVQFIVNKDGSLSNWEAVDGPTELREAALDVIKKSPRWIPAQQSGKKVKSFKRQPIVFRM
jgi:protein TonB